MILNWFNCIIYFSCYIYINKNPYRSNGISISLVFQQYVDDVDVTLLGGVVQGCVAADIQTLIISDNPSPALVEERLFKSTTKVVRNLSKIHGGHGKRWVGRSFSLAGLTIWDR